MAKTIGQMNKLDYVHEYSKEKYDRINLSCPKGTKDEWRAAADAEGLSLSAYVMKAVSEYQQRN